MQKFSSASDQSNLILQERNQATITVLDYGIGVTQANAHYRPTENTQLLLLDSDCRFSCNLQ